MSTPHGIAQARAGKAPKKLRDVRGSSIEANRLAVVILEVLAGGRSPLEAAKALGVTAPR